MLPVAMAWSSPNVNAIRYVYPVLWKMSCFSDIIVLFYTVPQRQWSLISDLMSERYRLDANDSTGCMARREAF